MRAAYQVGRPTLREAFLDLNEPFHDLIAWGPGPDPRIRHLGSAPLRPDLIMAVLTRNPGS
jgi:hypothetical protein